MMPLPQAAAKVKGLTARFVVYTLPEQIAEQIAKAIVDETFVPGQRLKEGELSAIFGVSRASIREALRLIETRGLVRIEPRRGARVTQLSAAEVDDLYEIRSSLLGLAARRVAARRERFPVPEAEELVHRLEQCATQPTHGKYFESAYALSNLIAQQAGSQRLFALIQSFSQQVARYTRLSLKSVDRRKKSVQNWKRLVAAIKAGEPVKAETAMQDLVFGSRDAVRQMLRDRADFPAQGR